MDRVPDRRCRALARQFASVVRLPLALAGHAAA